MDNNTLKNNQKLRKLRRTQQKIKAIIIDPETNLPTLAIIQGNIKQIFRGIRPGQREEFIKNFLPKNMFLATIEQLEPDLFLPSPEEN